MATTLERSPPPPPAPFSNYPYVNPSPWWYLDGSPPRPTVPANSDDDHLLLLLLVLIPIALFLVIGVCLCIYWCSNDNASEDTRDEGATATRALDKEVIESFPTMLYSEVKQFNQRQGGTLECAVCLSEVDDDDTLRLLPLCSHAFHPDCIDMWLGSHNTCPVCRAELTPSSEPPVAAAETPPVQVFVPVEEAVEPETMEEARVWAEEERERFTLRLPEGVRAGVVSRRMESSEAMEWRSLRTGVRRWESFDLPKSDGWATPKRTWSLRSSRGVREERTDVGEPSAMAVAC